MRVRNLFLKENDSYILFICHFLLVHPPVETSAEGVIQCFVLRMYRDEGFYKGINSSFIKIYAKTAQSFYCLYGICDSFTFQKH